MKEMAEDTPSGRKFSQELDPLEEDDPVDMMDMELVAVLDSDGNIVQGTLSDLEDDDSMDESSEVYLPERDDSIIKYRAHDDDIFTCKLSPNDKYAASGGQDDRLVVWDIQKNIMAFETSFNDSVIMIEFNKNGDYLAAGDMIGNVTLWKINGTNFEEIYTQLFDDVKWILWHPESNILLIGGPSLWKLTINEHGFVEPNVFLYEQFTTDVGRFLPDGKRVVIGYDDGCTKVIDITSVNHTIKFPSASTKLDSIISIAVHPQSDVIAVGSVSSRVAIFKTQPPKLLGALDCIETGVVEGAQEMLNTSVESLEFGISCKSPLKLLIAGTDNALHIIEYQKMNIRSSIKIEEGLTRFVWPQGLDYVLVATKKGPINIYNPFTNEQLMSFLGHSSAIYDISLSKDMKKIITSGEDFNLRIFTLESIPR